MAFVFDMPFGEGNPRNSEGSFVTLKDGRILFAYTRYNGDSCDDGARADIVGRISSDQGRTWGDYFTILKNDALNLMSVSLLRLQDGRIALAYLRKSESAYRSPWKCSGASVTGSNGVYTDCRPWFCVSGDECKTWSKPVDVAGVPYTYLVVNNDRLVQLKSGRIIIPAALHWAKSGGANAAYAVSVYFISDDGGATWRESNGCAVGPVDLASGLREPGVVELEDGRVFGWYRTCAVAQFYAYSDDGGENWTQPQLHPVFTSEESPLSMKRNPANGELFAVWDDCNPRWGVDAVPESWNRTPLVLARSNDEGATWRGYQLIETKPDHGYCYIAMHFTNDNGLLLAYCCGGGDHSVLQDLRIRRIELSELKPLPAPVK